MKKITIILTILLMVFAFEMNVFAASATLSVSKSSVSVGDSFTVTAKVQSAAAWNVHVKATGPVADGCKINQADASSDAQNTNKTFNVTCKANGEGTITLTMTGDVTSAEGDTTNLSASKTVNVTAKTNTNTNTNTATNTNTNTTKPVTNNTTTNTNTNKSTNNNLSSLTVEGYNLIKTDDNNYTLEVEYDVSKININAVPEYSKSTIEGTGEHELQEGENIIEIKVKSEAGTENVIKIKVTRKAEEIKQLEPVNDNNTPKEDAKQPSFNIVTHLIALVIGIAIGFGLCFIIKKNNQ